MGAKANTGEELSEMPTHSLPDKVIALGKQHRRNGQYVGIGAFLAFALLHGLRVVLVFGGHAVDIVEQYAPWASELCMATPCFEPIGVRVVVEDPDTDRRTVLAVTSELELSQMNHWVVGS